MTSRGLTVAAPFVLTILIYGAGVVFDRLVQIGPFDRAQLGWPTLGPMAIALPTVVAWSGRRLYPPLGRLITLGVAALAAGLIVVPIALAYRDQCGAVGLPLPGAALATLAALIAATVLIAAVAAGWAWGTKTGRTAVVRALVAGAVVEAIGFVVIATSLFVLFFGACVVRP
jgi:hypothetical protein